MSRDSDYPQQPWDKQTVPTERQPPAGLEDRVAKTLLSRGLIQPDKKDLKQHPGWSIMRAALKTAAGVALVAGGVLIGRLSISGQAGLASLSGAEQDLYALLLYETAGYDRPEGGEALTRYKEYSRWVAEARRRGLFVTGEDLEVERGWLLAPTGQEIQTQAATSVSENAPLSGIFFIRADNAEQALALARELPHLEHGGRVLIQKTISTATPPNSGASPGATPP